MALEDEYRAMWQDSLYAAVDHAAACSKCKHRDQRTVAEWRTILCPIGNKNLDQVLESYLMVDTCHVPLGG